MGEKITFLFNRSEITAGTRGASLGPDAIVVAARQKRSDLCKFKSDKKGLICVYSNQVID
jgi:hypothetical protein